MYDYRQTLHILLYFKFYLTQIYLTNLTNNWFLQTILLTFLEVLCLKTYTLIKSQTDI